LWYVPGRGESAATPWKLARCLSVRLAFFFFVFVVVVFFFFFFFFFFLFFVFCSSSSSFVQKLSFLYFSKMPLRF
jgi:hypothetical protein